MAINKKLNIVMACDSYFPIIDGVAHVIKNYADVLSKENNVCLVIPNIKEATKNEYDGYKVIRVKSISHGFGDYPIVLYNIDKK
jgi:hypothetical protein